MMKPGLKRLILINSYIKGRAVEIRLDGHANLSGENAIGKTSLLKLIPFFYGSTQNRLCPKIEGKKSFVDYYLPHDKSYLVFEYATEQGINCVVAYRHASGDRPAYRFMGGAFNQEVFYTVEEDGRCKAYSNGKLKQQTVLKEVPITHQIETTLDYRAVLMNQKTVLERSTEATYLRRLVASYSLSPRHPIYHLEKVVEEALGSAGSVDQIKKVIANIMAEEGVEVTPFGIRPEDRHLVEELTALRDLESETPRLQRVISDAVALSNTRASIAKAHGELKLWGSNLSSGLEQQKQDKVLLQAGQAELTKVWGMQRDTLQSQLSQLKADRGAADAEHTAISDELERYESDGIYAKLDSVKQIPSIEGELKKAELRLRDLNEKDADAQRIYLQSKSALDSWRAKETDSLHQEKDQTISRLAELTEQENTAKSAVREQFKLKEDGIVADFQKRFIDMEGQITSARERSQASFRLPEEDLLVEGAEQVVRQREVALDIANDDLAGCRRQVKAWEETFKQDRKAKQKAQDDLERLNADLDELARWANPTPGTFRADLLKHGTGWLGDVGKVIRPELLERRDLKPSCDAVADTLYGWSLQLDAIEAPAYARTLEDLERQREVKVNEISLATQRLDAAADKYARSEKRLSEEQTRDRDATQHCNAAKALVANARQSLTAAKAQVQAAISQRKTQAQEDLRRLESDRKQLQEMERQTRLDCSTQLKSALADVHGRFAMGRTELDHALVSVQERLKGLSHTYQAKLKQMDADKRERLSELGITSETIERAEGDWNALSKRLTEYRGYQQTVAEFTFFKTKALPRLSELDDLLAKLAAELSDAEMHYSNAEATYKAEHRKSEGNIGDVDVQIRLSTENLSKVNGMLMRLKGERASPCDPAKMSAITLLEQDLDEALGTREEQEKSIKSGIDRAEAILSRRGRTPLNEAWTQACSEVNSSGSDVDIAMQKATILEHMLNQSFRQVKDTLLQQVTVTGIGLVRLLDSLDKVKKEVADEAGKISNSIKNLPTAQELKDIELRLVSRVERLEFWPTLQHFRKHWEEWKLAKDALPSADFELTLSDILRQLQMRRDDYALDNLFDLEIRVTENGNPQKISTDKTMNSVSSTGLSLMFLSTIYAGLTRRLSRKSNLMIHWTVDELARLSPNNAGTLVALMDSCGMTMVSAFPSTDESLLRMFTHRHLIDATKGVVHVKVSDNPIAEAIRRRASKGALDHV